MNASTAPVTMPVVLTVLHLSLAEMTMPTATSDVRAAAVDVVGVDAGAQERHVGSWRASLGHAYAEWADHVPGLD